MALWAVRARFYTQSVLRPSWGVLRASEANVSDLTISLFWASIVLIAATLMLRRRPVAPVESPAADPSKPATVAAELAAIANDTVPLVAIDVQGRYIGMETPDLYIWVETEKGRIVGASYAQSVVSGKEAGYVEWNATGTTPMDILERDYPGVVDKLTVIANRATKEALSFGRVIHY